MTTPMPASPFQYDSMVVPSVMDEAAALMMPPLRDAAADQFSSATSPSSVADTAAASKTPAPASDAAVTNSACVPANEVSIAASCRFVTGFERYSGQERPLTDSSSCGGGESGPTGRHWPSPSYAQSAEPMGGCTEQTEAGVAPGPHEAFTAGGPQRALPAVADPHETGRAMGFVLDEAAFMEAIEAKPLFLETFPLNARERA